MMNEDAPYPPILMRSNRALMQSWNDDKLQAEGIQIQTVEACG